MTRVYIVLLNWNGWQETVECLESLLRSRYADYRVVVCDNASTDDSVEKIKRWARGEMVLPYPSSLNGALTGFITPPVSKPIQFVEYTRAQAESAGEEDRLTRLVIIRNPENRGFSAGNNVGIRFAQQKKADYIWLLNNDTVVEGDALKELVYHMESDAGLGLVGTVLKYASQPDRMQAYGGGKILAWMGLDRFVFGPGPLHYIAGTSLFMRRQVVEQVGLLDEGFFFYWEDVDYSRRVLKSGWEIGVASNSVVYHKFSATIGKQSLDADRFKAASLTRYFKKHYRFRWWFPVMFHISGMVINRIKRGQFKRIGPILKAVFFSNRKEPGKN